jgi:hypothetical protein
MRQPPSMTVFTYMGCPEVIDPEASYDEHQRIKSVWVAILKDFIFETLLCNGFDTDKYYTKLYAVMYERAQDILCTSDSFEQYKADLEELLIRLAKADSTVWVEGNDLVN